jgi:hypothetical protein
MAIRDRNCMNLLQLMLSKNKSTRYCKFEQISNHIWFKDFNWDDLLSLDMKPEYVPSLLHKKDNYNNQPYLDYIKNLKEWEKTDSKLKITEQDKVEFEEWIKNF